MLRTPAGRSRRIATNYGRFCAPLVWQQRCSCPPGVIHRTRIVFVRAAVAVHSSDSARPRRWWSAQTGVCQFHATSGCRRIGDGDPARPRSPHPSLVPHSSADIVQHMDQRSRRGGGGGGWRRPGSSARRIRREQRRVRREQQRRRAEHPAGVPGPAAVRLMAALACEAAAARTAAVVGRRHGDESTARRTSDDGNGN